MLTTATREFLIVFRRFFCAHVVFCLLVVPFLSGCLLVRDPGVIANTTALKTNTLSLMDKAGDQYTVHAQEIADQNAGLQRAYEAAQARPNNGTTVKMWTELLASDPKLPGSGIYPRFISQWKTKGDLKPAYIEDKKETVGAAFDQIINLENAKPAQ